MAILTAVLSQDDESLNRYRRVLERVARRVLPAHLAVDKNTRICQDNAVLTSVHGRKENVVERGNCSLAGITRESQPDAINDFLQVGGSVPDGSFALVRSDGSVLEAVTDFAGSKSMWHARLKCGGVAVSTCLEIVVALLGDFCVDEKALGWFLSSGSSGPKRSWDKRVKPIPRDSVLRAETDVGQVTCRVSRVRRERDILPEFDPVSLREEIEGVLAAYDLDTAPWLLALSGGYDSRAILYGVRHLQDVSCVTWVDEDSGDEPHSDVAIARQLAARAGRKHEVKVMKRPKNAEEIEQSLRRFARYSDGRNDNVLAYLDGMAVWDEMSAGPAGGVLRGDELFGSSIALSASRIRHNMRLDTFEDFAASADQRELAGRHRHKCPSDLMRRDGETVSHWRLRLRANHEIPVVYAALNAIRSRFVESCCPLLDRRLVEAAASIEGHHLDERAMYTQAVGTMYPDIPIATSRSTLTLKKFLRFPDVAQLVCEHLGTDFARNSLGSRFSNAVGAAAYELQTASPGSSVGKGGGVQGKLAMPLWAKRLKRRLDPPLQLDNFEIAFRSYLASIIGEEMKKSAQIGSSFCDNKDRAIA